MRALVLTATALVLGGCGTPRQAVTTPTQAAVSAADESWRNKQPVPTAASEFYYPPAQHALLDNGVHLYLVPRSAGTVALAVSARVGGAACEAGQSGLASLTVRLMTEGTRTRNSLQLAEAVETLGATLDHDTGRDGSSLWLEVVSEDVPAGLDLLADVVTQPRFSEADFERVRGQWLDSLIGERQSPGRLASLAGMRAMLGPVTGAPIGGSLADVRALSRDDVVKFHRQHFVAPNLAVIAVGDLTLSQLKQLAKQHFGHLPTLAPPKPPALDPLPPPDAASVWLIDRPGSVQSAIFVGEPFPSRKQPGYEAREVMNNLLGGLFTSRLNLNLREHNAFTYGVRSFAIATQRWGAFISMTSVKTETTADALEQLFYEIETLRQGDERPLEEDELQRSKTDLIQRTGARLEHVRRLQGDSIELFIDDLPLDHFTTHRARISQVTRQDVQTEAKRLDRQQMAVVIVGDRQRIAPALQAKGLGIRPAPNTLTD